MCFLLEIFISLEIFELITPEFFRCIKTSSSNYMVQSVIWD